MEGESDRGSVTITTSDYLITVRSPTGKQLRPQDRIPFEEPALRRGVNRAQAERIENMRDNMCRTLVAADVHGETIEFLVRTEIELNRAAGKLRVPQDGSVKSHSG